MNKYCAECGSPYPASAKPKFCSNCGFNFTGQVKQSYAEPTQNESIDLKKLSVSIDVYKPQSRALSEVMREEKVGDVRGRGNVSEDVVLNKLKATANRTNIDE